ncbi:unnamed protein product [Orchesella dallaii]|uniref:C-type lectin domain-containing protein n=1 Tax=Orchesella dallaii TaxID=48710 RepID=A0ABP1PKF4_9HEXA
MMIASPRTLRLNTSIKPELNTNTTATFSIRNTTLIKIGTFGGISYFVDGIPRNWNDSKSFCESHEAHLAKIDNKDQLQFLRKAVLNLGSEKWSWISSTGEYEEPRFVNLDGQCPVLPPNFIFGLIERRCTYKFFSLCQTVDIGELLVTPDSISKATTGKDENNGTKSDENIRSTTESSSSEKYFTPGWSSEDESSEETQTTTESIKDIGKAVNQEKSRSEVFFQLLRDNFPWSSIRTIAKSIPVIQFLSMGDNSALDVLQELES